MTVRLFPKLKEKLQSEADSKGIGLSELMEEILIDRYNKKSLLIEIKD